MKYNIAIDGPAGAGKSTIAKILAKNLNLNYIDTGAMYRAITLFIIKKGINNENGIIKAARDCSIRFCNDKIYLNNVEITKDIKSIAVTEKVSSIAKIPAIRKIMVRLQQEIAASKGVIMDGRDIATIVIPDARYKFFLTADLKARAKRRYKEMIENGEKATLEQVEGDIAKRDKQDSERDCSPLKIADDAIVVDTTNKSIEEVVEEMICYIKGREGDVV